MRSYFSPSLLHRLRRAIGVVIAYEVDLAAVHAAIVVEHPKIGAHRLADDAVGRGRPAIRHDVADLDLGVGDAPVVFFLRGGRHGGRGDDEGGKSKLLNEMRTDKTAPDGLLRAALHGLPLLDQADGLSAI